jgi:hypothetical protein
MYLSYYWSDLVRFCDLLCNFKAARHEWSTFTSFHLQSGDSLHNVMIRSPHATVDREIRPLSVCRQVSGFQGTCAPLFWKLGTSRYSRDQSSGTGQWLGERIAWRRHKRSILSHFDSRWHALFVCSLRQWTPLQRCCEEGCSEGCSYRLACFA